MLLKMILTYESFLNEDNDDDENDDDDDSRDRFKVRIIEGLKKRNECLKNEIQNDDDLRVIQVKETNKQNQKHNDPEMQPTYDEGNIMPVSSIWNHKLIVCMTLIVL